jgi:hypothetical protein
MHNDEHRWEKERGVIDWGLASLLTRRYQFLLSHFQSVFIVVHLWTKKTKKARIFSSNFINFLVRGYYRNPFFIRKSSRSPLFKLISIDS